MIVSVPLDRPFPDIVRRVGIQALCLTFARAFDVEPPDVMRCPAERALGAFREFSAACMEEALVSPAYAADRRERLGQLACELGAKVRKVLQPRDDERMDLVRALYAAIEIDVVGQIPGELRFRRCYFSTRYTPALCSFMSAFDSGFVGGLCGGVGLEFTERLTAGAPCCRAAYVERRHDDPGRGDAR